MFTDEDGIRAIIKLQALVGIKESRIDAEIGWSLMSYEDKRETMKMYKQVIEFETVEEALNGSKRLN